MSNSVPLDLFAENENWRFADLPSSCFSMRARTVLQRLNIVTLGEFLDSDWETVQCWQLGEGVREEMRAIHQAMRLAPESWMQDAPNVTQNWPDELLGAALPVETLSTRARNVLQRNQLTTLGAFLNFDWNNAPLRQLGARTRAELLAWQAAMGTTPETAQEWLLHNNFSPDEVARNPSLIAHRPAAPRFLPSDWEVEDVEGQVPWPRLWPLVVREVLGHDSRDYQVIKRRFGLDGNPDCSLSDIGLDMKITRERVRQIETAALLQLRKILAGHKLRGAQMLLHPVLRQEHDSLKEWLDETVFALVDEELWEQLGERYATSLDDNEKAFFRLWLEIQEFSAFSPGLPELPHKIPRLWLRRAGDRGFASAISRSIFLQLRERVEPLPLHDLRFEVNRFLKQQQVERPCDEALLRYLVGLWPRVEEVAPDLFQTRFEFLPSNQGRAERILREWATQGRIRATISEICQEINARYAQLKHEGKVISAVISMACAASPHIINIGKSGQWTLVENAGETRPVHEILQEALLQTNHSLSVTELNQYVAQRRVCAPHTVACLLNQHPQFQRVGRGLYALRTWGLDDAAPVHRGEEYQREFDEFLLEIFLAGNFAPMAHAELVNELQARLGWNINTLRSKIARSPWIETVPISDSRLMAHWCDARLEAGEDKPLRQTKTRHVRELARELLSGSPRHAMVSATLCNLIEAKTGYIKPMIYTALAGAPNIERVGEPGAMVYLLKAD